MDDGNMDSFQALGLCEEAMHFDIEVSFSGSQPKIFDISTRDTVDKVKTTAFNHFCTGTGQSLDDYLVGINEKEKLEIEFVKFILAHAKIREDLEGGELVKIGLFKKGVSTDTTAKEKIDLNTDINFAERRSSVSISLSKLSVSKRVSSPPNTPPNSSKKKDKKDKHEETSPVSPMRHPLAISLPGRTNASSLFGSDAIKKDKHKRYHSENGVIPEEGPLSPSATKGPPTIGGSAPLLVKVPPSASASSPSLHPRSSARGRTQSVSHDIGSLGGSTELQPPQSPEQVFTLPSLPTGVTLPPLIDPMIKGFFIESGVLKNHVGNKELVITDALKSEPWYTQYFWEKEHSNYIGTDDVLGVFVVSVTQDSNQSNSASGSPKMSLHLSASHDDLDLDEKKEWVRIRAIVRTKKGDEKKISKMKQSGLFKSKKISGKDILQHICPYLSASKLSRIKDPEINTSLKAFEDRQLIKSYKFGVLYCAPGQTVEEQMFSNQTGSADFEEFLEALGERVTLQGWPNYRAGLDVKGGSTGKQSVYTKCKGFEIMYHVSTLLPYSEVNTQQLERKRHIGNDIVVIVFKEGDQAYDPNCIKSEFNHIFAVVSKVTKPNDPKTYYRLTIACKEGVGQFKPDLPSGSVMFEKGDLFREFLLCKLINGENASYEAPSFKIKIQRTRLYLLKEIESKFAS